MARACILLADGFEEIEAITTIDVLRRAEVEALAVGVGATQVRGSHGIAVAADRTLKEAIEEDWDLVVLPGGLPGATNLRDDPQVQEFVRHQHERGRRVAAICAAPIALGAAGVLEGKRATCYPGFEDQLAGATPSEERVVVDGTITTSRGPGTALEFALELVRQLRGEAAADELRRSMLVRS